MKAHLVLFALVLIIIQLAFVQSAPSVNPSIQVSQLGTLEIESPQLFYIDQGEDHVFNVHVINQTNLKTNITTQCALHLYNSSGVNQDIGTQWMDFGDNGIDFVKTVSGGTFSKLGNYAFDIQCNSTNEVGFFTGQLEVISPITGTGYGLFILLIGFALALLIFAIVMKNEYLGFISGALFILIGLWSIIYGINGLHSVYTDAVGYVSLGLGILFFITAAIGAAEGAGLFGKDREDDDVWGSP